GVLGGGVVGACTPVEPPAAPIPPVSTGKVRVRVFTEASPARLLAPAGRFVFVGTDTDLERWDVDGGVLTLSADHGLSGSHVAALAPDPERRGGGILPGGGGGGYGGGGGGEWGGAARAGGGGGGFWGAGAEGGAGAGGGGGGG